MLNRTPPKSSNIINSYRKRRKLQGPVLMYGAIALVILGFILLVVWLTRPGQPLGQYFATDTPTATVTFTPTNTSTPTATATITETSTITVTATPSEPFDYVIQEGDSLDALAQRFNLGPDGVLLIYYQNQAVMEANGGVIFVGQTIKIPLPGTVLPTTTRSLRTWDAAQKWNIAFCQGIHWLVLQSGSIVCLTLSSKKITSKMQMLFGRGIPCKFRSTS